MQGFQSIFLSLLLLHLSRLVFFFNGKWAGKDWQAVQFKSTLYVICLFTDNDEGKGESEGKGEFLT